jgi:phospholipase C
MRNRKKTTLLSTAALIAVAAAAASSGPVAGQSLLQGLISTIEADIAADLSQFGIKPTPPTPPGANNPNTLKTATPIKHLVVIFNENRSFDHYFGHYPVAANPPGEPAFTAVRGTPSANNYISNSELLTQNPNLNLANDANGPNTGATNPFRIDRAQFNTAGQNHSYLPEQEAFDNGALDLFPKFVGSGSSGTSFGLTSSAFGTKGQNLGYFDGNTVTALWNYAQHYAMSDNSWSDTFGPSTPGLLEMFAGNNNGIEPVLTAGATTISGNALPDGTGNTTNGFSLIGDIDPAMDVCSTQSPAFFALAAAAGTPLTSGGGTTVASSAPSIGGALKAAGIPFGSFVGGFNLSTVNANGSTGCAGVTINATTGLPQFSPSNGGRTTMSPNTMNTQTDYTQHHIWFQYFTATANPNHTRPASTAEIGHDGPANHAYDLNDMIALLKAGTSLPSVSFVKMAGFQDEHPGNSNALDAQAGIVNLVNLIQESPDWNSTAVIIAYDDSDGWYDHAFIQPTTRASFSTSDGLNLLPIAATKTTAAVPGACGLQGAAGTSQPIGVNGLPVNGRCGPGMRQPFVVISPWAKKNFIDHTFITQASIPQFIEDNWLKGVRLGQGSYDNQTGSIMTMFNFDQLIGTKLILDPNQGTVVSSSSIIE